MIIQTKIKFDHDNEDDDILFSICRNFGIRQLAKLSGVDRNKINNFFRVGRKKCTLGKENLISILDTLLNHAAKYDCEIILIKKYKEEIENVEFSRVI
jgi:hypothetical protein